MPWEVVLSPRAVRDLADLARRDRDAVEAALRMLAVDPSKTDLRKLSGRQGEWRLRVGRWRAILELDNATGRIQVIRVLPRSSAY